MNYDLDALKKTLAGKLIGCPIYYYHQIESTNIEAHSLALDGALEGTVVLADSQWGGKGRFQRSWHSPPSANIYTSIILRPQIPLSSASQIPILAGVAVAETLHQYCPGRIQLKWPNDVLIGEKKISGILSQAKMTAKHLDFIILGIGINVNMNHGHFSEEIRETATSLTMEAGREISRQDVLISLYENLGKWYKHLTQQGFDGVKRKWLSLTSMIGRDVEIVFQNEIIRGKATDLNEDGSLILITSENREIKVSAGDVVKTR